MRQRRRNGFSLIELLIVVAIILVIAAIAVPQMNKQLMAAHEMAAIRQINTIHQAQAQYNSQFGKYAASLTELGPPASGNARDRKSTRLNSSHTDISRMPSSA